jgi:hypothetical protein
MVVVSVTVFDAGWSKDVLSSSVEQPVMMAPTKTRAAMLRNLIVLFMANFLLGYWYSPPRPRSLAASRYSVSGQQSASQVSDILSVSFVTYLTTFF